MTRRADATLWPAAVHPDRPIPFTLTLKALAALNPDDNSPDARGEVMYCGCGYDDCSACAGYGWACARCGAAYFGIPPGDGLCADCRGELDAP